MFSYLRDFLHVNPDVLLVIAPLIGSLSVSYLTRNAVKSDWFLRLRKPSIYPPPIAFPLVWTALYLMLGQASRLIWRATVKDSNILGSISNFTNFLTGPLGIFWGHMLLNYSWSIIFFNWHKMYPAIFVCGAISTTGMAIAANFWRIEPAAGYWMIPYILWTSFATYLNYSFYAINVDTPSPKNE